MCDAYLKDGKVPDGLREEVDRAIKRLEEVTGKVSGRRQSLLVSVRSGARVSMPGMMETILNLGLNDRTVAGSPGRAAIRGLPGTRTGASCRCTVTWCSTPPRITSRHSSRRSAW